MIRQSAVLFAIMMMTVPLAGCTGDDSTSNQKYTDVSAGTTATCLILDDGSVNCWTGADMSNLNGIPGPSDTFLPHNLGEGRTPVAIDMGQTGDTEAICSILDDGSVRCWGYVAGYGSPKLVNLGPDRTAVAISAGSGHTCAILDNGSVSCWGSNNLGQLGDGTNESWVSWDLPTQTSSLGEGKTAVAISAGLSHTCVILNDGSVSCWGSGESNELGDELAIGSSVPIPTSSLGEGRTAVAITAGDYHTCVILDDGSVSCWGNNANGQNGNSNSNTTTPKPTQTSSLGEGRTAVAISAGGGHTCATLDDGSVSCWGFNGNGQLGDGTTTERHIPTQTSSLGEGRTAVTISAGDSHTCTLLDDGSVSCWGWNSFCQLGDGTREDRHMPISSDSLNYGNC